MVITWKIQALLVVCCTSVYMIQVCPFGPVWDRRATEICSTKRMYHCLLDPDEKNESVGFYVEKCLSPRQYIGKRYVFSGNLNALDCDPNTYTPQSIWSNNTRSSECPLQKSQCNEEGQVIVNNGTTKIDRTCRCNYREGYIYVKEPNNPCECFPKSEDCSCYVYQCSDAKKILSPDYECQSRDVLKFSRCDIISIRKPDNSIPDANRKFEGNLINNEFGVRPFDYVEDVATAISLILPLLIFIILVVGVCGIKIIASKKTPSIDIIVPDKIYRGQRLCLDCFISNSIGIRNVCWYVKDKYGGDKEIQTTNSAKYAGSTKTSPSLIIENVNVSDSGEYRCSITFGDKTRLECEKLIRIPEEILIQNMNVVSYYQPTAELKKVADFIDRQNTKLLILVGKHGSGKTQTAHKFCTEVKNKYSVIAKITSNTDLSFKDGLLNFANDMGYRISYANAVDFKEVVLNLKDCLNHGERKTCPYLIFLDNIDEDTFQDYKELTLFLSLMKDVSNLSIIIATTDFSLGDHFRNNDYKSVRFCSMEDMEYFQMWQDLGVQKKDIELLLEKTGGFPSTAVTVIQYMLRYKWTAQQFIDTFSSGQDEKQEYFNFTYQPQIHSLSRIKNSCSEYAWDVVQLIPYLNYDAISSTVLEACFFHQTRNQTGVRKGTIHELLKQLRDLPLSQEECVIPDRIKTQSTNQSAENAHFEMCGHTVFSFHRVTIDALQYLQKDSLKDHWESQWMFLLKLFCFEIDPDAVTDVTVERNLRFVDHAITLLNMRKSRDKRESVEDKFYMAYLHCAIGSTFLFERTRVEKAHKHLMKAREIALDIPKGISHDLTKDYCIYLQDLDTVSEAANIDEEHIKGELEEYMKIKLSEKNVKDFILGKYRNFSDINVIRNGIPEKFEDFDSHYLHKGDYESLRDNKLAMPITKLTDLFLSELLLCILNNNGLALNDLKYFIKNDISSKEKKLLMYTCKREFKTACALREKVKKKFPEHSQIFAYLKNDRNSRKLMISNVESDTPKDLDQDIKLYESMLQSQTGIVFDFGVVKLTDKSDIRHKCLCRRILLNLLLRKYQDENHEEKLKLLERSSKVMEELYKEIQQIEMSNIGYSLLSLPLLYIECGDFLLLQEKTSTLVRALKCFDNALVAEQSRGAIWTRFISRGFHGKIRCLQGLSRISEANKVIDEAISILMGRNRDEIIEQFRSLRQQLKYRVGIGNQWQ